MPKRCTELFSCNNPTSHYHNTLEPHYYNTLLDQLDTNSATPASTQASAGSPGAIGSCTSKSTFCRSASLYSGAGRYAGVGSGLLLGAHTKRTAGTGAAEGASAARAVSRLPSCVCVVCRTREK